MLLFNEKNEQLSIEGTIAELKDLNNVETPTQDEVEKVLGDYYNQALQLQGSRLQFKAELASTEALPNPLSFFPGIGKKILAEIKKIICAVLDGTSTEDQIIQAVLNALASIIPGGTIVKGAVQLLIKYLLSKGVTAFCEN